METSYFIISLVLIPLLGFITTLFIQPQKENAIAFSSLFTVGIQLVVIFALILFWLFQSLPVFNLREWTLFESGEHSFFIDFYFDRISATYLLVGSIISFLIIRYSRYYMHLENGYKRFFNTVLLFYFGYNWTVLSGNFETLFIGWEILGISSFLLIAFYRDRYLPVRNAVKVFSIYRIGDVGLLLGMWASHHLWHENITFLKLNNAQLVHEHLINHSVIGSFIALCFILTACVKSAMVPFSTWLPKAMEGPTPSSAIFYGSLSVHLGVFLLLRTFPFWEQQTLMRICIASIGFITAFIALFIARVQSTVKAKIAYSSIVHIGIMFIEIALGLHTLVLVHFVCNAFLRTYQLLISPSIVAYKIRDNFYHFIPNSLQKKQGLRKRIDSTLYILSVKEWGLDTFLNKWVFHTFKRIGRNFAFLSHKNELQFFVILFLQSLALFSYEMQHNFSLGTNAFLPEIFSLIALLMVMKSFVERRDARLAWTLIWLSHLYIAMAVSFNEHYDYLHNFIYLGGITLGGILGWWCLHTLQQKQNTNILLYQYYGYSYHYPKLASLFLLATLAMMAFPITPSFIGEDLLYSHIHSNQFLLSFFCAINFVLGSISLIRIYARLFLGALIHSKHATALPSA